MREAWPSAGTSLAAVQKNTTQSTETSPSENNVTVSQILNRRTLLIQSKANQNVAWAEQRKVKGLSEKHFHLSI